MPNMWYEYLPSFMNKLTYIYIEIYQQKKESKGNCLPQNHKMLTLSREMILRERQTLCPWAACRDSWRKFLIFQDVVHEMKINFVSKSIFILSCEPNNSKQVWIMQQIIFLRALTFITVTTRASRRIFMLILLFVWQKKEKNLFMHFPLPFYKIN